MEIYSTRIRCDIQVVSTVKPDAALLHLAWDVTPPDYTRSISNLAWCSASIALLEHFIRCGGSRLVAVGTCAEYDWTHGGDLSGERHPDTTSEPLCAHSKHVLQLALAAACESFGVSWAWALTFLLVRAARSTCPLSSRRVLLPLLNRRAVHVENPGLKRDYLVAADAAEALVAILQSGATGCLNVGSGRSISLGDFARSMARRDRSDRFDPAQLGKDSAGKMATSGPTSAG